MHCNFSTKFMREVGGKEYFEALMAAFEKNWKEHIDVYGPDNHLRLTASTKPLREQVLLRRCDRGASIRVPHSFVNNGYRGYLEGPSSELPGLPIPDRFRRSEDDRKKSRRQSRLLPNLKQVASLDPATPFFCPPVAGNVDSTTAARSSSSGLTRGSRFPSAGGWSGQARP